MKLKGTFYMKNGMIIEKIVDGGFSQRSVDNFLDSYRDYLWTLSALKYRERSRIILHTISDQSNV